MSSNLAKTPPSSNTDVLADRRVPEVLPIPEVKPPATPRVEPLPTVRVNPHNAAAAYVQKNIVAVDFRGKPLARLSKWDTEQLTSLLTIGIALKRQTDPQKRRPLAALLIKGSSKYKAGNVRIILKYLELYAEKSKLVNAITGLTSKTPTDKELMAQIVTDFNKGKFVIDRDTTQDGSWAFKFKVFNDEIIQNRGGYTLPSGIEFNIGLCADSSKCAVHKPYKESFAPNPAVKNAGLSIKLDSDTTTLAGNGDMNKTFQLLINTASLGAWGVLQATGGSPNKMPSGQVGALVNRIEVAAFLDKRAYLQVWTEGTINAGGYLSGKVKSPVNPSLVVVPYSIYEGEAKINNLRAVNQVNIATGAFITANLLDPALFTTAQKKEIAAKGYTKDELVKAGLLFAARQGLLVYPTKDGNFIRSNAFNAKYSSNDPRVESAYQLLTKTKLADNLGTALTNKTVGLGLNRADFSQNPNVIRPGR